MELSDTKVILKRANSSFQCRHSQATTILRFRLVKIRLTNFFQTINKIDFSPKNERDGNSGPTICLELQFIFGGLFFSQKFLCYTRNYISLVFI